MTAEAMQAAQPALEIERHERVLKLSLARPRAANALDAALQTALVGALAEAEADDGVGAVLLTAAPGRAFSAGADMKEFSELPRDEANERRRVLLSSTVLAMIDFDKPLVVLVRGKAVGAGCMLACLADEVLATEAAAFSLPELRLGTPTPLGIEIVAARAGRHAAMRLAQLGESIEAGDARACGLVDRLCDEADASAAAMARAASLAEQPGTAFRQNKRWLNRRLRLDVLRAVRMARRYAAAGQPTSGG